MRFEIIVDIGKPYTDTAEDLGELEQKLQAIYDKYIKGQEHPHVDVIVLENGLNVTEHQAIQEIVADILEE